MTFSAWRPNVIAIYQMIMAKIKKHKSVIKQKLRLEGYKYCSEATQP